MNSPRPERFQRLELCHGLMPIECRQRHHHLD
jgi:hypothetical protein